MPADDLALAIRIRADVQQVLDEMRKLNDSLGEAGERGRETTRSLRDLRRAAFEAGESWIGRMRAALERLRRDSDDAAEETRDVTVGAFSSMEHAVARFATTGRLSFSGFVDSVIADLARLAARRAITRPLAALIAAALPDLFGGGPAGGAGGGDASRSTQATAGQGAGVRRVSETPGPAPRRRFAEPPAQAARTPHGHVRASTAPPAIFDSVPRFHSRSVAHLRPDQIPVMMPRAEAIATPQRVRAPGPPSVTIEIENRGTPQREVSRAVRLDPRGLVVSIVTDDLRRGGPIRQTLARELGTGGIH